MYSVFYIQRRTCGMFITKVDVDSQAERAGLKRGDELLTVNGHNFQTVTHQRALDLLRGSTHLCLTVKANRLGFKEMVNETQGHDNVRILAIFLCEFSLR